MLRRRSGPDEHSASFHSNSFHSASKHQARGALSRPGTATPQRAKAIVSEIGIVTMAWKIGVQVVARSRDTRSRALDELRLERDLPAQLRTCGERLRGERLQCGQCLVHRCLDQWGEQQRGERQRALHPKP